jgi:hypothetical protein
MTITKKAFCLLITLCLFKEHTAQVNASYIDSVKEYIKYIDSVIIEFSINLVAETNIVKSLTHFSVLDKKWCGQAELYNDTASNGFLRLSYSNSCDSIFKLQDYYFKNNKIVFIRTVKSLNQFTATDQYYLNDEIVNAMEGELYLTEGYKILKEVVN